MNRKAQFSSPSYEKLLLASHSDRLWQWAHFATRRMNGSTGSDGAITSLKPFKELARRLHSPQNPPTEWADFAWKPSSSIGKCVRSTILGSTAYRWRSPGPKGEFIYHIWRRREINGGGWKREDGQENQFMMFLIYFKNNSVGKLNFFLMCVLSNALKAFLARVWKEKEERKRASKDEDDDGLADWQAGRRENCNLCKENFCKDRSRKEWGGMDWRARLKFKIESSIDFRLGSGLSWLERTKQMLKLDEFIISRRESKVSTLKLLPLLRFKILFLPGRWSLLSSSSHIFIRSESRLLWIIASIASLRL